MKKKFGTKFKFKYNSNTIDCLFRGFSGPLSNKSTLSNIKHNK